MLISFMYKTCYIGYLNTVWQGFWCFPSKIHWNCKELYVFDWFLSSLLHILTMTRTDEDTSDRLRRNTQMCRWLTLCVAFLPCGWPNLGRLIYTDYLMLVIIYCIIVLDMYKRFLMHFFQLQEIICYGWWWWWPYTQPIHKKCTKGPYLLMKGSSPVPRRCHRRGCGWVRRWWWWWLWWWLYTVDILA